MTATTLTVHRKLVRDGIPAQIEANGDKPITRTLTNDEFIDALIDKLSEEAEELRAARTSLERIKELADISEVLYKLTRSLGIQQYEVDIAQNTKRRQAGSFTNRIWLEATEDQNAR